MKGLLWINQVFVSLMAVMWGWVIMHKAWGLTIHSWPWLIGGSFVTLIILLISMSLGAYRHKLEKEELGK